MNHAGLNTQPINPKIIWQQTCALYQQAGIKDLCLSLQNDYQANVNMVLILSILQNQHYQFTQNQLNNLQQSLLAFSQQTTGLVRQARFNWQQYKNSSNADDYLAIKKSLLATELKFEQQEQHLIVELLNKALNKGLNPQASLPPASWYFAQQQIPADKLSFLNIRPD